MICSLMLAAVLVPWVYQGGMALAAAAHEGHLPALFEWLGAACGRSKFGRFFSRSLLFSALVLLPLLFRRIRKLSDPPPTAGVNSLSRLSWKPAMVQVAVGLVISGSLLWGMGAVLTAAGVYVPDEEVPLIGKLLSKVLVPAVAASLLEECLFRGLLLGLWLRSARTTTACVGTSLLFAVVHFFKLPAGSVIADPSAPLAGFELLGKILLHFTDPLFFVTDLASLVVVGLILAWARVRTRALWFSIGLHSGWIIAFKAFNLLYQKVPDHPLSPWGVGDSLRSGVIPLFTLGITGVVCHFALRRFAPDRTGVSRASR